jgi:hypothetical protein
MLPIILSLFYQREKKLQTESLGLVAAEFPVIFCLYCICLNDNLLFIPSDSGTPLKVLWEKYLKIKIIE